MTLHNQPLTNVIDCAIWSGQDFNGQGHYSKLKGQTRKMFLLTKTKCPKKVHCNIIYSRKRFLKIQTCSAERRSES